MLYGMSRKGWLPAWLGRVSRRTHTPLWATAVVALPSLGLALWLPLLSLAKATSFLILIVFSLVNLSLLRLKRRIPVAEGVRSYPWWVPAAGFVTTLALMAFQAVEWLAA
jgi:amino acid transporter